MAIEKIRLNIVRDAFPQGMHGASGYIDGEFFVVLNTERTPAQQEEDFLHEMLHIYRKDHFSEASAQQVEARAHAFFESA